MRRPNARTPKSSKPESNPDPSQMDHIKSFQFKQNPNNSRSSKTLKNSPKSNLITTIIFSISISILFFLFFIVFRGTNRTSNNVPKFGVIIDGGSTGSRIHVFEYRIEEGGVPRFDFGKSGHSSTRVNPGLSSFEDDPDRAGESLVELLDFARDIVPRELWGDTEVRLMATAGLRLLDSSVQDRILESCRRLLRSSGFMFRNDWASVITGSDEGLYAWVVANYALGTLGGDPDLTAGIIELGGASAQVTFVSRESIPLEFSRSLNYGNFTYHLYSNSLLHFGQNVAFDSLKDILASSSIKFATESSNQELILDPCTPKGYAQSTNSLSLAPESLAKKYSSTFRANGNFSECRAAAMKLLQRGKEGCAYQRCSLGATFIPKLHGRFLATENFFHTSQFFGLPPKAVLSNVMKAGQQFCEENWSNIRRKYSSLAEEDLLHYCFSSAYIVALLHDSLDIDLDDTSIGYANQVENVPLDWALGAFILQTTGAINSTNHGWISSLISGNFPNVSLIVGVAILSVFVACYFSQWRKPYFKTIYDLEKGRYIVTRINR